MTTRVLVVDDALSMRAIVSSVVESIGFEAITAESGEEALGLFVQHDIDIAVLDVNMEGIDGFETCRQLRKQAGSNWFPVIYLSATNSDENIVEGLDAGGDAYVAKPINPRVLEAILKAMGRIADMKSELAKANEELARLAAYDGLTQILNRRSFDESLVRNTLQAKREKTDLAMLLLDIDHFKLYNDHYGHIKGDQCLIGFAAGLTKSLLRPADLVFRYGGEEFAILLPNTTPEGTEFVAQRIQSTLEELAFEHSKSPTSNSITASIGIVLSIAGKTEPGKLIEQADTALYKAKEQGRNRFIFAD